MTAPRRRGNGPDPSRPRLRKGERRRQLLAAGKKLLARNGHHAFTLEALAEAAGVSLSRVARHFPAPPDVFRAVLADLRAATLDRLPPPDDATGTADPLALLHAAAEAFAEASRSHALELRILHRALLECDGDDELTATTRAFYLDAEARLARVIGEGQQTGVFRRSLDPRVGAWELIRSALGFALTRPLGVPLYDEPDYVARAVECLMRCLLKTDV